MQSTSNSLSSHLTAPITDLLNADLSELMERLEKLGRRMHGLNTNDAAYAGCYTCLAAIAPSAAQLWPMPTRLVTHQMQRATSRTPLHTERPPTGDRCFMCG